MALKTVDNYAAATGADSNNADLSWGCWLLTTASGSFTDLPGARLSKLLKLVRRRECIAMLGRFPTRARERGNCTVARLRLYVPRSLDDQAPPPPPYLICNNQDRSTGPRRDPN